MKTNLRVQKENYTTSGKKGQEIFVKSQRKKAEEKLNNYGPLIRNLQIMYPHYKFQLVPIVTGTLDYVPKCLEMYIHQLGFNKIETKKLVRNLQNISASGTAKSCKIFLRFHDS